MYNINEALPIKDYSDIVVGTRGYFDGLRYYQTVVYPYTGDDGAEAVEIRDELQRIKLDNNLTYSFEKLYEFAHGEEANYWSETEHFYFWTRIIPEVGDYNLYIKVYRK